MTAPSLPTPAPAREQRSAILFCCACLVAAVAAAYGQSLGGRFLYDDIESIAENATIRQFSTALSPPDGATVSGRPFLNLSFAVNYAVSGPREWSYHAANVAIHAASALLLLGIVRRTLRTPAAGARSAPEALAVAFAAALLWALHPLQTESVAYVVQRAESLMGFFYLLTLYAFIRFADGGARARLWGIAAFAACLLGMGTKEVMATAPLVVLLYDRMFVCGSFAGAWRRHRDLLVALALCWLPMAGFAWLGGGRSGTAGFGSGVAWWAYALSQLRAVALYLRLCVWPHPLVGDYGRFLGGGRLEVALGAVLVAGLAAGTVALLARNRPAGFLGASFLLILAPTTSVIPVSTEIIAEHRMYLPLAAVATFCAAALFAVVGRPRPFIVLVGALALALGVATASRTRVYRDAEAFWADDALKVPGNAGAWNNLGAILAAKGDHAAAIERYRRALALVPTFAFAHFNLGNSLAATGRVAEAASEYEEALKFRPQDPVIHRRLAYALAAGKRGYAAAAEYREALRLEPGSAEAWAGLGAAMVQVGNLPEAAEAYAQAVRLRPDHAATRVDFGDVLVQLGRNAEGIRQYREALRLEPGAADVHNNLGGLLAEGGDLAGARAEFEEALRLRPDYADARGNLERVRALEGQAGGRR
jgi:tetratricopeptide (TPR) repeat protein